MTLIKTCGMFRPADIEAVNRACPDMCGFVVNFPKSHRSVSVHLAQELAAQLASGIEPVAVVVDQPLEALAEMVQAGVITTVQLHGNESEAYIEQLRVLAPNVRVIKAAQVRTAEDVRAACETSADLLLLDSGQGSGAAFDWSITQAATRPFILAGGLSAENLPQAVQQIRPWGVDLSSSLETDKLKDAEKIQQAVTIVRRSNEQ